MSTFNLPPPHASVTVTLPTSTPSSPHTLSSSELLSFPAFKTWLSTITRSLSLQSNPAHPFHDAPYSLRSLAVCNIQRFGGGRIGFVLVRADVRNDQDETLPGVALLRGGSVGMLVVLTPDDEQQEQWVVLSVQPRVPAGSMAMVELPAGMLDDAGSFAGAAAKEIEEEVGMSIRAGELVDLTQLALGISPADGPAEATAAERLQNGVYTSAGGSDEFVPLFLARRTVSREELEGMKGRLTGLRDHGEKITVKLCRLEDVWKVAGRDAKALGAVALLDGLRRDGKL